jgi:acyl-CoA reductase-like NAD-dependent aldehyde dehydrogenase
MRMYDEESFGSGKPVIRVKDQDEAIRVGNGGEYGLSSALRGRGAQRAVAKRLGTGIGRIKAPTSRDEGQTPFGGVKAPGYGRFGDKAAIAEFTELRSIAIEGPQVYPF